MTSNRNLINSTVTNNQVGILTSAGLITNHIKPLSLFARVEELNVVDYVTMIPDSDQTQIPLIPEPGVSCAISTDNLADVGTTIIIEFYQTPTSQDLTVISVNTNGQTKVVIPDVTIFRISSMFVSPTSLTQLDSQLFLYNSIIVPVSGIPSEHYDYLLTSHLSLGGFRQTGILYCPPGHKIIVKNIVMTSSGDRQDVWSVMIRWGFTGSIVKYARPIFVGVELTQILEPYFTFEGGSTIELLAKRINGQVSECEFSAEMVVQKL